MLQRLMDHEPYRLKKVNASRDESKNACLRLCLQSFLFGKFML